MSAQSHFPEYADTTGIEPASVYIPPPQPATVDTFRLNADECARFDAPLIALRLTDCQRTAVRVLWEWGEGQELITYTHKQLADFSGLQAAYFDEHLREAYRAMIGRNAQLVERVKAGYHVPQLGAQPSIASTAMLRTVMDAIESEHPGGPVARVAVAADVLREMGANVPDSKPARRAEAKPRTPPPPPPPAKAYNLLVRAADDIAAGAEADPSVDELKYLYRAADYLDQLIEHRRRARGLAPDDAPMPLDCPEPEPEIPITGDCPSTGNIGFFSDSTDLDSITGKTGIFPDLLPDAPITQKTGTTAVLSEEPGGEGIDALADSMAARVDEGLHFLDRLDAAGEQTVQVLLKDDAAGRIVEEAYEPLEVVKAALPGYFELCDALELSLIVRASGGSCVGAPGLVQIDDATERELEGYAPLAFMVVETSPGSWQPWLALEGVDEAEAVEIRARFFARAKDALERANPGATGCVRMPGSRNFKREHAPDFPVIRLVGGVAGRTVTVDELAAAGLLAPERPSPPGSLDALEGEPSAFPDYSDCLHRAGKNAAGTRPDRSKADLLWVDDALLMGHRSLDSMARALVSLSDKARRRRDSYGYAVKKVKAVARKHGVELAGAV